MKAKRKTAGAALVFFLLLMTLSLPAAGAGLNVKVLNLRTGNTYKLKVKGAGKKKVKWKSSKKSVASVSKKGVVKARKPGSATITAKAGKKKYTCKVTVRSTSTVKQASGAAGSVSKKSSKSGFSSDGLAGEELRAWNTILSYQSKYPEGKRFTNDDYYKWNGGIYRGGYGCAAFCFILSDACFGMNSTNFIAPVSKYDLNDLRPGDILRVDYNTHSVTVVNKIENGVIVAEANYNKAVHWGREISFAEIRKTGTNIMTRYNTQQYTYAALLKMQAYLPVLDDPKD